MITGTVQIQHDSRNTSMEYRSDHEDESTGRPNRCAKQKAKIYLHEFAKNQFVNNEECSNSGEENLWHAKKETLEVCGNVLTNGVTETDRHSDDEIVNQDKMISTKMMTGVQDIVGVKQESNEPVPSMLFVNTASVTTLNGNGFSSGAIPNIQISKVWSYLKIIADV